MRDSTSKARVPDGVRGRTRGFIMRARAHRAPTKSHGIQPCDALGPRGMTRVRRVASPRVVERDSRSVPGRFGKLLNAGAYLSSPPPGCWRPRRWVLGRRHPLRQGAQAPPDPERPERERAASRCGRRAKRSGHQSNSRCTFVVASAAGPLSWVAALRHAPERIATWFHFPVNAHNQFQSRREIWFLCFRVCDSSFALDAQISCKWLKITRVTSCQAPSPHRCGHSRTRVPTSPWPPSPPPSPSAPSRPSAVSTSPASAPPRPRL